MQQQQPYNSSRENGSVALLESFSSTHSDIDSGVSFDEYEWIPFGISSDLVLKYFASLPSDRVPLCHSKGMHYRNQQLLFQLPLQDFNVTHCEHARKKEEVEEFRIFNEIRQKNAMGVGSVILFEFSSCNDTSLCQNPDCLKKEFTDEEVIVQATIRKSCVDDHIPYLEEKTVYSSQDSTDSCSRLLKQFWHPACFTCCICENLLMNLIYFFHCGRIFCGRHYSEQLKPRCPLCDELIFCEDAIKSENALLHSQYWHVDHFLCSNCQVVIQHDSYFLSIDEDVFCGDCFCKFVCFQCRSVIRNAHDESDIVHKANHIWHKSCFLCHVCENLILSKRDSSIFHQSHLICSSLCLETLHKGIDFSPDTANVSSINLSINKMIYRDNSQQILHNGSANSGSNLSVNTISQCGDFIPSNNSLPFKASSISPKHCDKESSSHPSELDCDALFQKQTSPNKSILKVKFDRYYNGNSTRIARCYGEGAQKRASKCRRDEYAYSCSTCSSSSSDEDEFECFKKIPTDFMTKLQISNSDLKSQEQVFDPFTNQVILNPPFYNHLKHSKSFKRKLKNKRCNVS